MTAELSRDQTVALPRDCTFHARDWQILARQWHPVALVRDVVDQPLAATLLDQPLVVYRAGEEIVVANDLCPHRGMPLSLGSGDGERIQCAYHGLQFGPGGACVRIPADPEAKIPNRMHLASYPAVERYGLVWTCLSPAPGGPAVPVMKNWDAPGFQQINCPPFDVAAFAGRQVEGFLDVAHFAFTHSNTFADPGNPVVPSYNPTTTDYGFEVDYWSTVSNYPHGSGKTAPDGFQWLRHFEMYLPFTATITIHFPDEALLTIMNAASPVSAKKTRMFAPIARNFDTDRPVQEVYDFNQRVFEEDRTMVESQKPENLPLDPRIEVNIAADRSSVALRRGLRSLGLSEFFTA